MTEEMTTNNVRNNDEEEETTVEETQNTKREKPVRVPNPHRDDLIFKFCTVVVKCAVTVGVLAMTFQFAEWAWGEYKEEHPSNPWVEVSPYLGKYPTLWNKKDGKVVILTTNKKMKPTWREFGGK